MLPGEIRAQRPAGRLQHRKVEHAEARAGPSCPSFREIEAGRWVRCYLLDDASMIAELLQYYAKPVVAPPTTTGARPAIRVSLVSSAGNDGAKASGDGPDVTWCSSRQAARALTAVHDAVPTENIQLLARRRPPSATSKRATSTKDRDEGRFKVTSGGRRLACATMSAAAERADGHATRAARLIWPIGSAGESSTPSTSSATTPKVGKASRIAAAAGRQGSGYLDRRQFVDRAATSTTRSVMAATASGQPPLLDQDEQDTCARRCVFFVVGDTRNTVVVASVSTAQA